MSRNLPTFQANVAIQDAPRNDVSSGIQAQIATLQNFTSLQGAAASGAIKFGEIKDAQEAKVNQQSTQQEIKFQISKGYEDSFNKANANPNAKEAQDSFLEEGNSTRINMAASYGKENRNFINNTSMAYENAYNKRLATRTLSQGLVTKKFNFSNKYQQSLADTRSAITNSNPGLGEMEFFQAHANNAKTQQLLADGFASGAIPLNEYERESKNAPVEFGTQLAYKKYTDFLQEGRPAEAQKFLTAGAGRLTKGFTFEQYQKFHTDLSKLTVAHDHDLGINKASLDNSFKKHLVNIQENGVPINQGLAARLTPQQVQRLHEGQTEHSFLKLGETASQSQIEGHQKLLKSNLTKFGMSSDDINDYMDKASAAAIRGQQVFNKDPAAVITKNQTSVQDIDKDNSNLDQGRLNSAGRMHTTFNPWTPHAMDTMKAAQEQHGLTKDGTYAGKSKLKLMTNAESQGLVSQINSADPSQTIKLISVLEDQSGSGENFSLNMDQLHKDGLASGLINLGSISSQDSNITSVVQGLKTPTAQLKALVNQHGPDTYKDIQLGVTDAMSDEDTSLGRYVSSTKGAAGSGDAEFITSLQESASKIAGQLYANGLADSPSDAATKAAKIVGNRFSNVDVDNSIISHPKDMNGSLIAARAIQMKSNLPMDQFQYNKNTVGAFNTPEEAEAQDRRLVSGGHWQTSSDNHHAMWVDLNGNARFLKDGKPYEFSFNDANQNIAQTQQSVDQRLAEVNAKIKDLYNPLTPINIKKADEKFLKSSSSSSELEKISNELKKSRGR